MEKTGKPSTSILPVGVKGDERSSPRLSPRDEGSTKAHSDKKMPLPSGAKKGAHLGQLDEKTPSAPVIQHQISAPTQTEEKKNLAKSEGSPHIHHHHHHHHHSKHKGQPHQVAPQHPAPPRSPPPLPPNRPVHQPDSETHTQLPSQMLRKSYKGNPTFLLEIVGARDLKASDSDGSSDPFVKVFFFGLRKDDTRRKTDVVFNNLNPIWNAQLKITLPTQRWSDCPDMILWVMDHDKLGPSDFLGEVRISAADIKNMSQEWTEHFVHTLTPPSFGQTWKGDQSVKGTLTIRFRVKDGYKIAYFGKSLQYSYERAVKRGHEHLISAVVKRLNNDEDLKIEGITRIPGSKSQVDSLSKTLDQGKEVDWKKVDPYTCTSLLKFYLSSLPEPLLTPTAFAAIME
eukprot:TRINITY_DN6880_c0_g1_i2.p1 TRINITY_DN6880_c0_g1~~TRINITY_DN6880_c0_g1_i2.p1  ORF type:complete len:399 (+),score=87.69 TRINITY_DN6880_c0_g1_i2:40-1236(+)